ncbi:hypothetical protein AGABI2DRAFT_178653 [Agaricus bisporus var. bisporus H97]|uniref:hypothetical protein n=1 Tax=Agaricus bisporus var. bisporus (strain H97 / ATCC MYA-4626 / FGSC 10389) TaxID=936046 RepID=UPI00029F6260|nr:hypothetical protein AGABI2DRAFT_178653 [Agaricus bisporus var. bisporus H97]EKV46214.1 hypothetical protein AGABI2DRAFT_178653 [Agaricus bisporus var. bisporus H97]
MLYYPGKVAYIFLALSAFHFDQVLGRGGRGGGGHTGGSTGDDSDSNSLELSPSMTAVFALTVVVSIVTLYQLVCTLGRFRKRDLPEDHKSNPSPYDIGPHFLKLLFGYLFVYLTSNILYALAVAYDEVDFLRVLHSQGLHVAAAFTAQLAYVLLFAILLSITRHRQRIQLNVYAPTFNLKFLLDAFLLLDILVLGIVQDAIGLKLREMFNAEVIAVVFHVLVFYASIYTTIYAILIYMRLSRATISDSIIWTVAFLAGPALVVVTLYRLITISIAYANSFVHVRDIVHSSTGFFHLEGLLIADTTIAGVVFLFVAECCLHMGAPPRAPKKI